MKKFEKLLWGIILISITTSCKQILLHSKGVKTPKIETETSTMNYLGQDYEDIVDLVCIAKDSICFTNLITLINGFPSVDFFDTEGRLLVYSSTGDCTGKVEKFTMTLSPHQRYLIDSSYHWKDIEEKLLIIHDKKDKDEERRYDFTIVIYWAKYMGKLNSSAFKIITSSRNNKSIKPKIVLVNMDFQDQQGWKKVPNIEFR